jgi:hypothetical protein
MQLMEQKPILEGFIGNSIVKDYNQELRLQMIPTTKFNEQAAIEVRSSQIGLIPI